MAVTTNRGRSDTTVDLSNHIADIANGEIVSNDGVGYDTRSLLESANGQRREY